MNPETKGEKNLGHLISGLRGDIAEGIEQHRSLAGGTIVPGANAFKFVNHKQGIRSPIKKSKLILCA